MIIRTTTITTKTIIYELAETKEAVKEVNELRQLRQFRVKDYQHATRDAKGHYVVEHSESETVEPLLTATQTKEFK